MHALERQHRSLRRPPVSRWMMVALVVLALVVATAGLVAVTKSGQPRASAAARARVPRTAATVVAGSPAVASAGLARTLLVSAPAAVVASTSSPPMSSPVPRWPAVARAATAAASPRHGRTAHRAPSRDQGPESGRGAGGRPGEPRPGRGPAGREGSRQCQWAASHGGSAADARRRRTRPYRPLGGRLGPGYRRRGDCAGRGCARHRRARLRSPCRSGRHQGTRSGQAAAGTGCRRGFGPASVLAARIAVAKTGAQLPGGDRYCSRCAGSSRFTGVRNPSARRTRPPGPDGEHRAGQGRGRAVLGPDQGARHPGLRDHRDRCAGLARPVGELLVRVERRRATSLGAAATKAGLYVTLDLQPGRASLLAQAKIYRSLLKLPDVGLALDPEWKLQPGQRPLRQIGSVSIAEVNSVAAGSPG